MKKMVSVVTIILIAALVGPTICAKAETRVVNNNAVWTWWFYPQCVSVDTTTYYGYVDNHNNVSVGSFDTETGETNSHILLTAKSKKKNKETNDHNSVSVTEMYDGRIMCAYTRGHSTGKCMFVSISDKPGSISSFSTVKLKSSGKTGYAQVVKTGGRYFLFYRVKDSNWAYRSSADGVNWSEENLLIIHAAKFYCLFRPTSQDGVIRIVFNCHKKVRGKNSDCRYNHIRGGFLHTNDGLVYGTDNTTPIGSEHIRYTEFPVIMNATARTRLLDVAARTDVDDWRIIYNEEHKPSATYYLFDNSVQTPIVTSDTLLCKDYPYGAAFLPTGDIIAFYSERGNMNADIFERSHGDKTLNRAETLITIPYSRNSKMFRPIVSENGVIMWLQGRFSDTDYHDYNTSAYIYSK